MSRRSPLSIPRPQEPPELRLDRIDGGLSNKYIETQLNDNQSPYMLNMTADDRGGLIKRFGQTDFIPTASLETPIHRMYNYKDKLIVAHGTKISAFYYDRENQDVIFAGADPDKKGITLYTGTANQKGSFFTMGEKLYYLNGKDYLEYDNETMFKDVIGYIPTVLISKPPGGGGTKHEDFNMLSPGFKESFSGNNTATIYHLSLTGLDATPLKATVNGTEITEGNGFTVNRSTGRVTFTTAPDNSAPNNVVITAYKTISGRADHIKKCRYTSIYGGKNDTRVFIAGNPDNVNRYYYSDLYKPDYFPENSFNRLGAEDEAITGFALQYDTLVVFKEKSIYNVSFMMEGGISSFPVKPLNSNVGCDMPDTIKIVQNNPVFCNSVDGVNMLIHSQTRDERNVRSISGNVNGSYARDGFNSRAGLLHEKREDLVKASAISHRGKYYLCVGEKVWVWDFELKPYEGSDESLAWFYFEGIEANCFYSIDQRLFWGNSSLGRIVTTNEVFRDFGEGYLALWRSKLFTFSIADYLKTISEVWFTTRSEIYSKIEVKHLGQYGELLHRQPLIVSRFMWSRFAWDTFSWQVINFIHTFRLKPKIKKTLYYQIEFTNEQPGQNLSILALVIRFIVNRKVK